MNAPVNANNAIGNLGNIIQQPIATLKDFKSPDVVNGSSSFLDSNSYVAKTCFLILVVILFVYFLRMCIAILGYFFKPDQSPYIIDGTLDGNNGGVVIEQNPSASGAITILRSVNDYGGIGITWSVWLNIKQTNTTNAMNYYHVFNKGSNNVGNDGIMNPNNAPGLYLKSDYSGIRVYMSTYTKYDNHIEVDNIPIKKWFNVIIRVTNTVVDVFINGVLTKRFDGGIPFQNYGNINVLQNNGFNGMMSSLRYYNRSLGTREILDIVNDGPNLKMVGKDVNFGVIDYLSQRWFHANWV